MGIADDAGMPPLRQLAVTVFQPADKTFRWRVVELTPDGQWFTVDEQASPMKAYSAAMAAGLLHLQGLVDDLAVGPREEDPEAPAAKAKRGAFGFGFGLPRA